MDSSTISRRHPSAKQAHPEIIQNKSHNGQARFVAVAETGIGGVQRVKQDRLLDPDVMI